MKRFTLIAWTLIMTFAITAFMYISGDDLTDVKVKCQSPIEIDPPTFFYNLSSGCNNTISKERMHNAKTISDLVPDYSIQENLKNNIISARDVIISIEAEKVDNNQHRSDTRNGNILSEDQINLLTSTDYATNFFLEGYFTDNNEINDPNKDRYFNYCMTVVPEQEATYKAGNSAFIDYMQAECQSIIATVQKGKLTPGQISFTVTKTGSISNINLISTCGYPSVDEKVIELMNNLPYDWDGATNAKGEKINQTLAFHYGQGGC